MGKYNKEKAQEILDLRNGNFDIIRFNGVRSHSLVKCRRCGYE